MRVCADCGKRAAYRTGQTRRWDAIDGPVAVAVNVATHECESSCNACGHTFWSAT
jgi:hypothetical protein